MKNIVVLGSTGSIGTQVLDVVRQQPQDFRVVGLSAGNNMQLLEKQITEFLPEIVCVEKEAAAMTLSEKTHRKVICGEDGLCEMASYKNADTVINALSGSAGIVPSFEAVQAKKVLVIANKESLVSAGTMLVSAAIKMKTDIIPVDSEMSAIFQLVQLASQDENFPENISRVILTCSGGPFRGKKKSDLQNITVAQALKHPVWKMGKKNSIDSATLINKGMELIAITQFFGIPEEKIEVVVHKEGRVHSMIELQDGQIFANMSVPDMRFPIAYAMNFPDRKANTFQRLDFSKLNLHFEHVDENTFEAIQLARQAIRKGGLAIAAFNAANEAAIDEFMKGNIAFLDILDRVKSAVQSAKFTEKYSLDDVMRIHKTY